MEDLSAIIVELRALIVSLQAEVQHLRMENAELKARLAQNSTNSHKPPASDGLAKKPLIKPGLPKETGKKQGGQPGHQGKTLCLAEHPDTLIQHLPTHCQQCGQPLQGEAIVVERRQVVDLPSPKLWVEEHQLLARRCQCGCLQAGRFPDTVAAPVQYGPRIHAHSILLNSDYKVPFAKVGQFWADLTGYAYNPATLISAQTLLAQQLVPIEDHIRQQLQAAPVCHFDETGIRVGATLHWLHVACTDLCTYLFVHPKRGQAALKAPQSVFMGCTNWLVHDCWSSYFAAGLGCHALCGAHLLRELQAQIDRGRSWASDLHAYLLALYKATRQGPLPANEHRYWLQTYRQLCEQGLAQEPLGIVWLDAWGQALNKRAKQTKGRNLLDRLVAHESAVLAFGFEVGVPFSNNQAERDLRPAKIKQKVSGGFRTESGAKQYARIAGFISTLRKHDLNVVEQLANVFRGSFQWVT